MDIQELAQRHKENPRAGPVKAKVGISRCTTTNARGNMKAYRLSLIAVLGSALWIVSMAPAVSAWSVDPRAAAFSNQRPSRAPGRQAASTRHLRRKCRPKHRFLHFAWRS